MSMWALVIFILVSSDRTLGFNGMSVKTSRNPFALSALREVDNLNYSMNRRTLMAGLVLSSLCLRTDAAKGADLLLPAESASLQTGLLETRVNENVLSPPPYGMEGPDVYYPSWFAGLWNVESKTLDVQAPCGIALFGGNVTYQGARKEVGTSLNYESRFIKRDESSDIVIADREYNVKSIAKAAIGVNSVVDIPYTSPNKLTCVLVPPGSPSMLQVDLFTVKRRQEFVSDIRFDCSEVVREIVSPVGRIASAPVILKEVETTSIYSFDPSTNIVSCRQRSASFLLPSQQSPTALKMWEASRGRPVDVRFYDVVYTKR